MKIITLGKYGALGNNFFRFIHACAYSMDHNVELYYSDRRNIDKYFTVNKEFIKHKTTPWLLNRKFLRSLLRRIDKSPKMVRFINRFNIYVHDHINRVQKDEQLALSRKKKNAILFVLRDFRSHASLARCVEEMRKAFDLRPELTQKIDQYYLNLKTRYKMLIGVHIRRGDYQEWRQGKYFLSDEVYVKTIIDFVSYKKLCLDEVGIIICSNGAPLIENFPNLNIHYEVRPEEEDLYLMKNCDYIIAPPSTFSSMSSFMGSVPMYFIEPDEEHDFERRLHICSY